MATQVTAPPKTIPAHVAPNPVWDHDIDPCAAELDDPFEAVWGVSRLPLLRDR